MFCKNCGTQMPDGSKFCEKCGTSTDAVIQRGRQSQMDVAALKKDTPVIALGMAVIAFISGIITLFNLFDVTISSGENSAVTPVSYVLQQKNTGMVRAGNIIFGLVLLVIAIIGFLFFIKRYGINAYDSLTSASFLTKESPLFAMGLLGSIGAVLQFIFFIATGDGDGSIYTPWFTWVLLALFVGSILLDKCVLSKKK